MKTDISEIKVAVVQADFSFR